MNLILILLIIIIILSILYLYYQNTQYNKILESFDSSTSYNETQNSLSTYFQSTTDSDDYKDNKNIFNELIGDRKKNNLKKNGWDGEWVNEQLFIDSTFIQNNDKILITLRNSNYNQILNNLGNQNNIAPSFDTSNNPSGLFMCPPNLFIGIGQLNHKKNMFILINILCNTYQTTDLDLIINNLSGELIINKNVNQIVLYSNSKPMNILLTPKNKFRNNNMGSNYINRVSPFINGTPHITNSFLEIDNVYCNIGTSPCKDISYGITDTSYNNLGYNACGTPVSVEDNTCSGTPQCVLYSPAPTGTTTCGKTTNLYDYMNFMGVQLLSKNNGSTLELCDHLTYFNSTQCNSVIICYTSNIGDVYTLNYEFFGTLGKESSITVQKDIMYKYLNKRNNGLLYKTRNSILKNSVQDPSKAISFTNCLEFNNKSQNSNARINESLLCSKIFIREYLRSIRNKLHNRIHDYMTDEEDEDNTKRFHNFLMPAVWQINYNPNNSSNKIISNSCNFNLSTSKNYDTPVKYVEFNEDGTNNLSLYHGGVNQSLVFDNARLINKTEGINDTVIVMTANIRTNNNLYLIPSTDLSGFSNNSHQVRQVLEPKKNGKWLIIGFKLNDIDELLNKLSKINI